MHVRRFQSASMPIQSQPIEAQVILQLPRAKSFNTVPGIVTCQPREVSMNLNMELPQIQIPSFEIINLNSDFNEYN
jgi:hypothetical protein